MATSGLIRFIVPPVLTDGPWIDYTPPPGAKQVDSPLGTKFGTVTISIGGVCELFTDAGIYINDFAVGTFPPGFKVISINQVPIASGTITGMPWGSNGGGAYAGLAMGVSGGATVDWAIPEFGFADGAANVFIPATMSYAFCGFWTLTATSSVVGIGQIAACNSITDISSVPGLEQIRNPYESNVPVLYFTGNWTADDTLCPVIGPVTNVQIVDAITGEFSWDLPAGADGVIITLSRTGFDDIIASVLFPLDSYLPSNIYGAVSVVIKPVTTFPICYGQEYNLVLAITTPYEPFGPGGSTGGIDLGGSPTLQFIGNPSGIYTLVPDQYRDILYERIPAPATNPVKIPRPFIKGPFVGD